MGISTQTSEICVSSDRYFAEDPYFSNFNVFTEIYQHLTSICVSASRSMLDKLVVKLEMLAGSCTAWNMESSPMDKCQVTRLLEVETTRSTPSSVKLVLESMSPELYSWTWSHLLSMKSVLEHTVNFSILNN